jgi:hypothetical protein
VLHGIMTGISINKVRYYISMYAELLNWTPIPDKLIEFDLKQIKKLKDCSPYPEYEYFRQYQVDNPELLNFIQQFFEFDVTYRTRYQIVKGGLTTHIDKDRTIIHNFLIDVGGDDVYNAWFADDKITEIFRITIPLKTWHKLDVSTYHNVIGVTGTRTAITVYKIDENNSSNS